MSVINITKKSEYNTSVLDLRIEPLCNYTGVILNNLHNVDTLIFNTEIEYFTMNFCKNINSLIVPDNSKVKYINCSLNKLREIAFGTNILLEDLNCDTNVLSVLDLTNCNYIQQVNCSMNMISKIYFNQQGTLKRLTCCSNIITSLDCPEGLTKLICSDNYLTRLSIPKTVSLLFCEHNCLTSIKAPKDFTIEPIHLGFDQMNTSFYKDITTGIYRYRE